MGKVTKNFKYFYSIIQIYVWGINVTVSYNFNSTRYYRLALE